MRQIAWIGAFGLVFTLGFAGAWALQEGEGEGGMPTAPPLEDPWFDNLEGEWEWKGTLHEGGKEIPMKAKESMKWSLGHQFLLTHLKSFAPDGSVAFEGMGVHRSNPTLKTYRTWWFDSSGVTEMHEGRLTGKALVQTYTSMKGPTRSTFTLTEAAKATYKKESKTPGTTEWVTWLEVEGTKK